MSKYFARKGGGEERKIRNLSSEKTSKFLVIFKSSVTITLRSSGITFAESKNLKQHGWKKCNSRKYHSLSLEIYIFPLMVFSSKKRKIQITNLSTPLSFLDGDISRGEKIYREINWKGSLISITRFFPLKEGSRKMIKGWYSFASIVTIWIKSTRTSST